MFGQQPVVFSVPDAAGRYYVMQVVDAWTNHFAYVGARATGSDAGESVIVGPGRGGRGARRGDGHPCPHLGVLDRWGMGALVDRPKPRGSANIGRGLRSTNSRATTRGAVATRGGVGHRAGELGHRSPWQERHRGAPRRADSLAIALILHVARARTNAMATRQCSADAAADESFAPDAIGDPPASRDIPWSPNRSCDVCRRR